MVAAGIAAILARWQRRARLKILQLGIEDNKFNFTRFWVLARATRRRRRRRRECGRRLGQARSLVAALESMTGTTSIWSSSSRGRGGARHAGLQLHLLLDFWDITRTAARGALLGLLSSCAFVKLLGSYDAAPPLAEQLADERGARQRPDPHQMRHFVVFPHNRMIAVAAATRSSFSQSAGVSRAVATARTARPWRRGRRPRRRHRSPRASGPRARRGSRRPAPRAAAAVHRYVDRVTEAKEQRIVDQRSILFYVMRRAAERVQGHHKPGVASAAPSAL